MFTAQDIFDIAIRLEENGEKTYRAAMAHAPDEALKALLAWMAQEEKNHAEWFSRQKDRLRKGEDHHLMQQLSSALVEDVIQDQAFSLQEVDFSTIKTAEEMIRVFIGFEDDTIAFYEVLKALVMDEEVAGQLDRIIAEERNHITQFQNRLSTYRIKSTIP